MQARTTRYWILGAFVLAAGVGVLSGCSHAPGTQNLSNVPLMHDAAPSPGWQPRPGVHVAGQPAAGDWEGYAKQGISTVVNLRLPGELPTRDAAAEVRAAGMRYVTLPVAGTEGITFANASRLREVLEGAGGPVLVHCSSGNRAGALLALDAVTGGMSAEQALDLGRAAGMTSAEPRVRELLGLPASP